ncbi:hypothetical protein Leryth_012740 [Lithospermum erythrorhizon]|nr:hypothetical protein Leryth_012740 [Lithospermum erythrorhizon]
MAATLVTCCIKPFLLKSRFFSLYTHRQKLISLRRVTPFIQSKGVPRSGFFCRGVLNNNTNYDKSDVVNTNEKERNLWLYNTMSKQKELFKPAVVGKVGMYVCGVTAYDLSHIGHARVYVSFDVLYRYLRHLGYEVKYVRNFTDVDDKIITRAKDLGDDPLKLSRHYCEEFHRDMAYLCCLPPSEEPRVSDHIPHIIDMIQEILNKGSAYTIGGDVYFSVDKFPEYGQLSGRKLEDNRAGERVAVDSRKKNPADFVLWKSAKEGEPFWQSPWGPGRPGWHIECSAMSAAYLGYTFDIHGGGMDLIFPHHENEIAQSCAACDKSNIRYWVHNGFVTIDSQKMSKSLGNFFTIRQVIDIYHPFAVRYFLISTHYRSPINYSDVLLESASDRVFYIYQTLEDSQTLLSQPVKTSLRDSIPLATVSCIEKFHDEVTTSMSDDLHTNAALAAMSEPLKLMNDLLHTRKGTSFEGGDVKGRKANGYDSFLSLRKRRSGSDIDYGKINRLMPKWTTKHWYLGKKQEFRLESLAALEKSIRNVLSIVGLMPSSYKEALQQLKEKALKRSNLTEDQVLQRIEEREAARSNKEYEKSDAIRKDLAAGNYHLTAPEGTTWRPAIPLALQELLLAPT